MPGVAVGLNILVPNRAKAPIIIAPGRGRAPITAAGGGSCPADGSPDVDQATEDNAQQFGLNVDQFYAGQKWVDASTRQICKVRFYLGLAGGSISAKFYTARIYTLSGSNLGSVITNGQSAAIAGNNSWSNTGVVFSFASNPTVTGGTTYAYVCYVSDASGNPVAADGTNKAQMNFKETTNPQANASFQVWNTSLVLELAFSNTSDAKWSLYWFD